MKLKNIYTLIILLFIGLFSYGQETIINIEDTAARNPLTMAVEDVYYFKDTNNLLDKFVGAWVFDDGTHYLRIVITKHLHVSQYLFNDFDDKIFIKTEYKLNGVEKYNTTGGIGGNRIEDLNIVKTSYNEPSLTNCSRRKKGRLKLEYSVNISGEKQLTWTRTDVVRDGWGKCPDGTYKDNSDFLIPANLVLTKE